MTERATTVASGPAPGAGPAPGVPRPGVPPVDGPLLAFAREHELVPEWFGRPLENADNPRWPAFRRTATDDLVPLPLLEPTDVLDPQLDDDQRDAVARALQTPDAFLLNGGPGSGKKRVAVEIIRQAIAAGRRVLLTGPTQADVEAVVRKLTAAGLDAVRLAPHLPEAERFASDCVERAHEFERASAAAGSEDDAVEAAWAELEKMSVEREAKAQELARVRAELDAVPDRVREDAARSSGDDAFTKSLLELEQATGELIRDMEQEAQALKDVSAKLEQSIVAHEAERSRLQAKPLARWVMKLTGQGRVVRCEDDLQQARQSLSEVRESEAKLRDKITGVASHRLAAREELIDAEVARRRTSLQTVVDKLTAGEQKSTARLAALVNRLPERHRPSDFSEEAIGQAAAGWRAERTKTTQQTARWSEWAEHNRRQLAAAWVANQPVVAFPLNKFNECRDLLAQPFDLGVVIGADRMTEPAFTSAALAAIRWTLVGDGSHPPGFFATLCHRLHREAWTRESDRLTFHVLSLTSIERERLEVEPIADRPEIELRIVTRGGEALVAEVAFPANTSPGLAREFLFRELGIIPCQPRARCGHWVETAGGFAFHLRAGNESPLPPRAFDVGPGVALHMTDPAGDHREGDYAFIFNAAAGWDRGSAREWLLQNVWRGDTGRTSRLVHNYRHSAELAGWLTAVFSSNGETPLPSGGCVVFEPVAGSARRLPAGLPTDPDVPN